MLESIFKVIPLRRVPRKLEILNYLLAPKSKEPQRGEIVKIVFGKKKISGVVWAKTRNSSGISEAKLKSFETEKNPQRFSNYQIALSEWLAENTLAPLNVIFLALTHLDFKDFQPSLKSISKPELILANRLSTRENLIKIWSNKISSDESKTLVIVPTYAYAETWLKHPSSSTVFLHAKLTQAQEKELLKKLPCAKLVVATFKGLFYPLPKFGRVIVDQADDEGFFAFDQMPRLDIRQIARFIADLNNARLIFLARWPSPTILAFNPRKPLRRLDNPLAISLIDREKENFGERKELISSRLLTKSLTGKNLWLISQKFEVAQYRCRDCQAIVSCPKCRLPLKLFVLNKKTVLICERDNLKIAPPEKCENCQGSNFSTFGFGPDRIVSILKKSFPNAKIALLQKTQDYKHLKTVKHLIATTAIANYPQARFDNVIILNPEIVLNSGEYRAKEKFVGLIFLAGQFLQASGSLFIQVSKSDILGVKIEKDFYEISKNFLNERKTYHYPPFGCIVMLKPTGSFRKLTPPFEPEALQILKLDFKVDQIENRIIIKSNAENKKNLLHFLRSNLKDPWSAWVNPPDFN
ncbi:hypothetical protein C4546_02800 [Candidatus Parcubacteria bacterium]|nr:MAG: hypothetical protein C4546_02800 [Candidatus Parcubacteria bacterium]